MFKIEISRINKIKRPLTVALYTYDWAQTQTLTTRKQTEIKIKIGQKIINE